MKPLNLMKKSVIAAAMSASYVSQAYAAGYDLIAQSVSGQSTANASIVEAADASALFYNPAGLTYLSQNHISLNVHGLIPRIHYQNAQAWYPGTKNENGVRTRIAVSGSQSGEIGPQNNTSLPMVLVPHLYASHQINDHMYAGLGVYVPFGSGVKYEDTSVLRYNSLSSDLKSIDLQPTIAYRQNQHSVALGIIAQYTQSNIQQYANFWSALNSAEIRSRFPQMSEEYQGNGRADGVADIKMDGWGFGFSVGWIWDMSQKIRLGVTYRSAIRHQLGGTTRWQLVSPIFTSNEKNAQGEVLGEVASNTIRSIGYVESESASTELTTPNTLTVAGLYHATPKLDIFGNITWRGYSVFNQAEVRFGNLKSVNPNPGKRDEKSGVSLLYPRWEDTFYFALGAGYQLTDSWQFRMGVAYDHSPVKHVQQRLSGQPDANRIIGALGVRYAINPTSSLNLAYSLVKFEQAQAQFDGWCGGSSAYDSGSVNCVSSKTNGTAEFNSVIHAVGMQYNYQF